MTTIYALIDPFTGEVRYVGRTSNVKMRFKKHRSDKEHLPKYNWMQACLRAGKTPELVCIQTVPREHAVEAETFWRSYFEGLGCPLFNKSLDKNHPMPSGTRQRIARTKARPFKLIHESGTAVIVENLKQFCRDNKLNFAAMYEVANKQRKSYKGYDVIRLGEVQHEINKPA